MTTAICKEFKVEEEAAEKDILELVNDLVQEGLVSINENSAQAEPNQKP